MDERFSRHGAFSWNELKTSDLEEAKKFYSTLFDWTLEAAPMEALDYTMIKVGGNPVGGMMTTPPEAGGAPPAWGAYVTVDDVDATAKRAEELGGTLIVPPRDIPEVGRFCVIQDPQGALISVITYVPM